VTVEKSDRRLHALPEIMRAFAEATADYDRLVAVVAQEMSRLIGDGCFVAVLSEDQTELHPVAVSFRDAAADAKGRAFLTAGPIRVEGPTLGARVVRTRAPARLPRVDLEALAADVSPAHSALIRSLAISSFLSLPLEVHGRVLGFVSLARVGDDAAPFSEDDEAIARNLAEHAALAISTAQLLVARERELAKRRRAEEEAGRFVALIQASGEFIATATLDGKILFVNDGGRRLLGLDPDADLSQMSLKDFHTEDGMKRATVIREKGRWQGQGQLRNVKTGELIDMQVSSFLVRDAAGQPFCYATVQHDMRETKRLEAQLRQSQKMEAIGTLAGGIAHDFNNILGAIIGNLELARYELPAGHGVEARLEEIATASRRAMALVRQILAFGRQNEMTKRAIRLQDVVEEAVALLRSTISANVELVVRKAPDVPNVTADATQVHQILMNLCTNAWQAMGGKAGRITIALSTARAETIPETTIHGAVPPPRWARLEVIDDGPGMEAEVVQRIFDPFFTTKAPGEGTGLGLSVVHGIVREHGGFIRVDSKPGQGTRFEVLLPGVEATADETAVPEAAVAQGRGRRVLYLDDEESLVRMIEALLGRFGYRVSGFTRPGEAFAALRRDPRAFDAVLTDQNMPGVSGLEVAQIVTSIRADLPVILTSGHVPEHLEQDATAAGVREILQKPCTIPELCAALERVTGDAPADEMSRSSPSRID
jgi:PAS domain S-box-containing protein